MKEFFSLVIEIYKEGGIILYITFIPLFIGTVAAIYTRKIRYFFISIGLVILFILALTIYLYISFATVQIPGL